MNAFTNVNSSWLRTPALVVWIVMVTSSFTFSQEDRRLVRYKQAKISAQEIAQDRAKQNARKALIRKIVSNQEDFAGHQNDIHQWYRGFIIPLMTRYRPVEKVTKYPLRDLEKQRELLLRDLRNSKQGAHREYLKNLLLDLMPKIASGNYHPAVRFNAMLIVGELNEREAILVGAERSPAEPLATALPHLYGELNKKDQIDVVRVACLAGLRRHSELARVPGRDMKPEETRKIAESVFPFVSAETSEERSKEVYHWMQRRAIEILVFLEHAELESKLAAALGVILNNPDAPRSLRLTAATAIGQTHLPPDSISNPSSVALAMCRLARDACQEEINWVDGLYKEQRQLNPRSGGRGPENSFPGIGLADFDRNTNGRGRNRRPEETEQDKQMKRSRRRLMAVLSHVRIGLAGKKGQSGILAKSENPPHQTNISDLSDDIHNLMVLCDEKPEDLKIFLRSLKNGTAKLQSDMKRIQQPGDDSGPGDESKEHSETRENLEVDEEPESIDFDEL